MPDYDVPKCGGLVGARRSGKGGGPRTGNAGSRHQVVRAFPTWLSQTGTDVYFSSRWDSKWQVYDRYWTRKTMDQWWTTLPFEWVYIQEVAWDEEAEDFVWEDFKTPSSRWLYKTFWRQRLRAGRWR